VTDEANQSRLFLSEANNGDAEERASQGQGMSAPDLEIPDELRPLYERVKELLGRVSSTYPREHAAVLLSLCDDETPNQYGVLQAAGMPYSYAASNRHILDYIRVFLGIDPTKRRLDRELRDYYILPLRDLGLLEKTYVYPEKERPADGRLVERGSHKGKSGNNSYTLSADTRELLLGSSDEEWADALDRFIAESDERRRKAIEAKTASIPSDHGALIDTAVDILQSQRLPEYDLVYIDDGDNERVENEWKPKMVAMGLALDLDDKYPDAILAHPETRGLWVVDAVISDGELNKDRCDAIAAWAEEHGCHVEGFVTAYLTWKKAGQRQGKHRNIAAGSYMWIAEDGGKLWRADSVT
jgi:hypothetical protein